MSNPTFFAVCDDSGPRAWARVGRPGIELYSHDGGQSSMSFPTDSDIESVLRRYDLDIHRTFGFHGAVRCEKTSFQPGQFHPRIQREGNLSVVPMRTQAAADLYSVWIYRGAPMAERYSTQLQSSVVASSGLFGRMTDVFRCIEPDGDQGGVYGHELRHLLILACTEVESSMKAILKANGVPPMKRNYTILDYQRLERPMRLVDWQVELHGYPAYPRIAPFVSWETTATPHWWKAYNETKHDRERSLPSATLQSVIEAIAAVSVLIAAQFGIAALREPKGAPLPFKFVRFPRWEPAEFYVPPCLPAGNDEWREMPVPIAK